MANKEDVKLADELGQLQTRYDKLAEQEPPTLVDQAVINLAKRELETQQARQKRRIGWISTFSTASLLVITLSMVLQQQPGIPPAPVMKEQDVIKSEVTGAAEKRKQRSSVLQSKDTYMAAPAEEEQKLDISKMSAEMNDAPAPASSPTRPMNESLSGQRQRSDVDALGDEEPELAGSFDKRLESRNSPQLPEAGQWLDDIRKLKQDGYTKKAQEELGAFKLAYPDYELPADLRD